MTNIVNIWIILFQSSLCLGQINVHEYILDFTKQEAEKIELDQPTNRDSILIRIWQSNYQVLEIRRSKDEISTGKLVNYVTKYNRREKPLKVLKEVIDLKPNFTDELLNQFITKEIGSIKDSDEIRDYPDGLDGKTTTIEFYFNSSHRISSYWEIENDYYMDPSNPEIRKIRSILEIANSKISWWPLFKRFRDQLKPGSYRYGGINMIVMK